MLFDKRWEKTGEAEHSDRWRVICLQAADLVRQHGLAKETQIDRDGSMCLQGALSFAATGAFYRWNNDYELASKAVTSVLVERGERIAPHNAGGGYGNAMWNNARERTAADVIEVLEAAALRPEP